MQRASSTTPPSSIVHSYHTLIRKYNGHTQSQKQAVTVNEQSEPQIQQQQQQQQQQNASPTPQPFNYPPVPKSLAQDPRMMDLLHAWYYCGYTTGRYDGYNEAQSEFNNQ
jgi:hypothetical protein